MQGLNFIHAGFLAAGLAVALPIVIHLLFRQRTRTVTIGSVRFLHQVVREHRRRRRVRQWLLLSLRMLAVLLLVLLFSRPYWDQSHLRGLEQEIVLLLDRSASMQARDSRGESSFDRALVEAKDELSQLDENVLVHVAAFDATGVLESPVEQLAQSTPTEAATDFGLAFSWARDILAASNRATRRIVLVTDLQQTGLPRTPLDQLPEGIELIVRDAGDPLPRNVAIELAEATRTEIRPDRTVAVRVVLRNHGPLPVRNLKATCEVENGQKLASAWIVRQTSLATAMRCLSFHWRSRMTACTGDASRSAQRMRWHLIIRGGLPSKPATPIACCWSMDRRAVPSSATRHIFSKPLCACRRKKHVDRLVRSKQTGSSGNRAGDFRGWMAFELSSSPTCGVFPARMDSEWRPGSATAEVC
ncbi:MAG: BatA domain-containing protein [Planctomycetaceae bacterium]